MSIGGRSARWVLLSAAVSVVGSTAVRSQNPNGFLQRDQWACLVPLQGNDCSGNGPHAMAENWVAPHNLPVESPVIGTVWSDIDFGGAARSAARAPRRSSTSGRARTRTTWTTRSTSPPTA